MWYDKCENYRGRGGTAVKLKKWTALLLCLLMMVQLSPMPSRAAGNVYFTGAQENILPLSDDTMPFWKNDYLYVPAAIFSGSARDSLQVGYSQASDGSWVALYWGTRAILFKKGVNYAEDQNGKHYYPGVAERNDTLFVPAGVVAAFFNLKYSVSTVRNGSLVWLRTKDFSLTEDDFLDAASGVMDQRYREYQDENNQPQEPEPETPPAIEELISGKKLYLCARATENTKVLLDLLDRYDSRMTFFCTPEFMAENHDLLRRMSGTGHGVGILAEEGEGLPPVADQVKAANRELEMAACTMTRLVRLENGSPETAADLLTQGYCTEISGLKPSRNTLSSSARAADLFREMSAARKTAVVWLDDAVNTTGLVTFLSQSKQADDPCVPLRETTDIFS